jgi:sec-independent protein translocase protein TatC
MSEAKLMGIWDHFDELRKRLLLSLLALCGGVLVSFIIADRVLMLLTVPIGGLKNLQSIEVTENIGVFMRVSLLGGFILAFPIIFYQILAFITPGLQKKEKKWIYFAIPFAFILFLGGVLFSYFVMLPATVPFLVTFLGVRTTPRLSNYINFVTNLMFWIGISFEAPLFIFILAKLHIVNARILLKGWRIAIIFIALLAAIVTPTVDPVNMALLMVPLLLLYVISILLALLAK